SAGTRARLWESTTGRLLRSLEGHAPTGPSRITFSSDGSMVATADDLGVLRLWDVSTGKQRHVLRGPRKGIHCVVFSPDGKLVVTGGPRAIRFWDIALGQELTTLEVPIEGIGDLRFTPDGATLVSMRVSDDRRCEIFRWVAAVPGAGLP